MAKPETNKNLADETGPVVYLLECPPWVKVGLTKDMARRFSGYTAHNPSIRKISVRRVGTEANAKRTESALIAAMNAKGWAKRTERDDGEWFQASAEAALAVFDGVLKDMDAKRAKNGDWSSAPCLSSGVPKMSRRLLDAWDRVLEEEERERVAALNPARRRTEIDVAEAEGRRVARESAVELGMHELSTALRLGDPCPSIMSGVGRTESPCWTAMEEPWPIEQMGGFPFVRVFWDKLREACGHSIARTGRYFHVGPVPYALLGDVWIGDEGDSPVSIDAKAYGIAARADAAARVWGWGVVFLPGWALHGERRVTRTLLAFRNQHPDALAAEWEASLQKWAADHRLGLQRDPMIWSRGETDPEQTANALEDWIHTGWNPFAIPDWEWALEHVPFLYGYDTPEEAMEEGARSNRHLCARLLDHWLRVRAAAGGGGRA